MTFPLSHSPGFSHLLPDGTMSPTRPTSHYILNTSNILQNAEPGRVSSDPHFPLPLPVLQGILPGFCFHSPLYLSIVMRLTRIATDL